MKTGVWLATMYDGRQRAVIIPMDRMLDKDIRTHLSKGLQTAKIVKICIRNLDDE